MQACNIFSERKARKKEKVKYLVAESKKSNDLLYCGLDECSLAENANTTQMKLNMKKQTNKLTFKV